MHLHRLTLLIGALCFIGLYSIMKLRCEGHGCEFLTANLSGLTNHRKTCLLWRNLQDQQSLRRRERAAAQSMKKALKMKERRSKGASVEITVDVSMGEPSNMYTRSVSPPLPPPASPLPPPPPPPTLTQSGRPRRNYTLPKRFQDVLPALPDPPLVNEPELSQPSLPRVRLIVRDRFISALNIFGLWRDYPHRPSFVPDGSISVADLANKSLSFADAPQASLFRVFSRSPPWPFRNMSIYRLMTYFNSGSITKSAGEANRLVEDVLLAPDFTTEDLRAFNAHQENQRLDDAISDPESSPFLREFSSHSINIDVPSGRKDIPPSKFLVPGLLYRKVTSVIKAAFRDPLAHHYHFSPFKLFHRSPVTGKEERVMGEVYTSDAFIAEHDHVQLRSPVSPDDPDCKREKIIAAVMFSSDGTHLTNFGIAKAWPIYLMLGNLSKYFRGLPNSGAMHHVAYIPSLPDSFQDFASTVHEKWKTQKKGILTHCRRELMHAVWAFLLDDDFIHAYKYGMVIMCLDGIERRVYPRLFTYSADYPEKVLLATMRDKGLYRLGLARDGAVRVKLREFMKDKVVLARHFIYELGHSITGIRVEELLKEISAVPTINAFASKLSTDEVPFNPSKMLVVDLLHEFELGVWKTLFKHLIRLLYAASRQGDLVAELDFRYRQTPTFGRDTIRKFANNASEMKKLAARDFEDLLQCSIPAFEDLLPEPHNKRLMKLLYRTAEWHALAKARMHTDSTVELLEALTTEFGQLIRQFRDLTCSAYNTVELPGEAAARVRRTKVAQDVNSAAEATEAHSGGPNTAAAAVSTPGGLAAATSMLVPAIPSSTSATLVIAASEQSHSTTIGQDQRSGASSRRTKKLNLHLYKLHSLGDYASSIRAFGTTDSYSTQLGELAHRLIKTLYARTNKKDALKQIAKQVNRRTVLCNDPPTSGAMEFEELANAPVDVHHVISNTRRSPINIYAFVNEQLEGRLDPAKKVGLDSSKPSILDVSQGFIPKLQDHLLGRLLSREFDGDSHEDFTDEDRNDIRIIGNSLYSVQLLRVNYTTYDIRRASDTINPRTHKFIMVRSPETGPNAHPFWYAQVMGIFHAVVRHTGPRSRSPYKDHHIHFLWVRWLGVEPGHRSQRRHAKLPKLGFVPHTDPYAFGFLDPSFVIRGSHLIPSFASGTTSDLLPAQHTTARPSTSMDDWINFYVNIFVDRDMFFRYLGGGIGHLVPLQVSEDPDDEEPAPDDDMDIDGPPPSIGLDAHYEDEESEDDGEDDGDGDGEGEGDGDGDGEGDDGGDDGHDDVENDDNDDEDNDEDVGYGGL
ncbi:hypothetical protein D9615_002821 [Tricholomella constricta]|uniref:Uncharacterized protein n=1 Tax=Tricholomella constricta TaxID=117010 RepID=A0A8H5HG43_9AGAR|nr:hypothetical protein D9615_002821 [Tricholomella constricta]